MQLPEWTKPALMGGIVEEAGWAVPLGAEKPDRALAEACQMALVKDV